MDIICIGGISYDMSFLTDEYPRENVKHRFNKRIDCGGGPASNAAYLLGLWKTNTAIVGAVGDDLFGSRIKDEFKRVNVDTSYLDIKKNSDTKLSFIIVNTRNGNRTVFSYSDKNLIIKDMHIKGKPKFILLDGQQYDLTMKLINDNPEAVMVMDADRVNKRSLELAKKVDFLVASTGFAEQYTKKRLNARNRDNMIEIFDILDHDFKAEIVITLGSDGCLYKHNGVVKLMPAYKVKAVDTTGAGDIFHGAFVYGLYQEYDYEKIIKIATIAGGISALKVGSRYSIPTLDMVINVYDQVG